jgi:glutaminyl-peptide cyclotransferase
MRPTTSLVLLLALGAAGAVIAFCAPARAPDEPVAPPRAVAPPAPAPPASAPHDTTPAAPARVGFDVESRAPHDPAAFTQGLVLHDGKLFESTGGYGSSTLRRVDRATGKVEKLVRLPAAYFGEGMTILGDRIFMLTWREHVCFVYTLDFEPRGQFTYEGEGWGLTHDGKQLIMSDGTSELRFVDPATWKTLRTVRVQTDRGPVTELNELELVRGTLYANIWGTDHIVQIDPASGKVVGDIDLTGLYPERDRRDPDAVLNGIAWDEASGNLLVTGKRWGRLFEIRLRP